MAARQRGAKGMLVVTGPSSPNAGETIPMTFDTALAGSGIVAASISGAVADAIFGSLGDTDKTLAAAQKALDSANPHVAGFAIPDRDRRHQAGRARARRDRPRTSSPTCRRRRRGRRREAVGRRSAPTTITSGAATTATRWPTRTTPARFTSAPTTTRRDRPPCWRSARSSRRAPRKRNVLLAVLVGRRARPARIRRVRERVRRCRSISLPRI